MFSRNNYINSLAVNGNTLATADNQGIITSWDIKQLRTSIDNCKNKPNQQSQEALKCRPIENVKEDKKTDTKDRNKFYALQSDNSQITQQWLVEIVINQFVQLL